jgi:hypothetical protein
VICCSKASIQKAQNGPYTQLSKATHCIERLNTTIKAEELSIEFCTRLIQHIQAAKQSRKMAFVTPPDGVTLGGETCPQSISQLNKQIWTDTRKGLSRPHCFIPPMMKRFIQCPRRYVNLFSRLKLITAMTIHHPPHKSYIPVHPQTIYLKYVMFIDIERTTELTK